MGHSSFRFKAKEITLITDPFDPEKTGLKYPAQKADIVTISHNHPDHNYMKGIIGPVVRQETFVVDRPGEYEIGGVEVRMMSTHHDNKEGAERGSNLIAVMRIDDLFVAHLGDLGHVLSEKKIEDIGNVDVLLIPVGGVYTIDAKAAAEVVNQLEPSIVIPMHYGVLGMAGVEDFLKLMGIEVLTREKKVKVTKDSLPENMQIIPMEV